MQVDMMTLDSPHGRFLKVILALGIVYPVLLPVAYFSKFAPRGEFAALAGLLLLITLSVCALITAVQLRADLILA